MGRKCEGAAQWAACKWIRQRGWRNEGLLRLALSSCSGGECGGTPDHRSLPGGFWTGDKAAAPRLTSSKRLPGMSDASAGCEERRRCFCAGQMLACSRPFRGTFFVREQESKSLFLSGRRGLCNLSLRSTEKSRFDLTNPWPRMTNKSGICP